MPQHPGSSLPDSSASGVQSRGSLDGDRGFLGSSVAEEAARLIAFSLDQEWYALDASLVRGIEPEMEITPVPRAPDWLLGVFNLHGSILPAVDLRPLLRLSQKGPLGSGLLVVFLYEGNATALRVDLVDEIYELPWSSLETQASAGEGEGAELILGQVRVRDRLIGVLSVPALLRALMEG